ncbi:hypothetical protein SKAU_G00333320 [Synaphobranchus kaupii]|uniref:Uncharacterized protein n=1 Tax=Synaphobranchus kaupii TaxID=118154 RepID=A0A9Q1IIN9_SYNKA|nr:hypothetical protein SKAU_G00333320 [Synaphobranchus kaupii]
MSHRSQRKTRALRFSQADRNTSHPQTRPGASRHHDRPTAPRQRRTVSAQREGGVPSAAGCKNIKLPGFAETGVNGKHVGLVQAQATQRNVSLMSNGPEQSTPRGAGGGAVRRTAGEGGGVGGRAAYSTPRPLGLQQACPQVTPGERPNMANAPPPRRRSCSRDATQHGACVAHTRSEHAAFQRGEKALHRGTAFTAIDYEQNACGTQAGADL